MATSQRIKVRVADLVERVEVAKSAAWARHQERLAKYDADTAEYKRQVAGRVAAESAFRKLVARRLREQATAIQRENIDLNYDSHYRNGKYVDDTVVVRLKFTPDELVPDEPSEPAEPYFDGDEYDRDIGLLKMSTDDVITVSTSDRWARYL